MWLPLLRIRVHAWQGLATVMRRSGQDSLVLGMVEDALTKAKEAGKAQEATNVKMLLGQLHALQVRSDAIWVGLIRCCALSFAR